jgi:hypothetical protein
MERELTVVAARTEFHIEKIELARSAQSFVVRSGLRRASARSAPGPYQLHEVSQGVREADRGLESCASAVCA